MVRCGWSIPQVGHLCGAVAVWVVGQGWANPASASLPPEPPHPLSSYSPANKTPWRPLSGAAPRHPTTEPDPPNPSAVHSFLGGPVLSLLVGGDQAGTTRCRAAVLPADQPNLAVLPASRFAAPLVSTGGSPSVAALRLGWPEGATPRELQRPAMDNPYLRGV